MNYKKSIMDNNQQENIPQKETKLVDISITDENVALNVLVNFLSLAQRRGVFGLDESAKIWECIKMFHKAQ
jgi:hypothetical protein